MTDPSDPLAAIEDATCLVDQRDRAIALEGAIDALKSRADQKSAEVQYALGYAWYWHPVENTAREEAITAHLNQALRIKPDHKYALLYLAHDHFDRKRYAQALELLEGLSPTEFSAWDQAWRDAKAAEMMVCCRLYLNDAAGIPGALSRLFESLASLEPETSPAPSELSAALRSLLKG